MTGFRNEVHKMHARALRSEMTMAEYRLWYHLRAHRFMGLSVRRQAPIGPFIVDFLIPSQGLIVELDGGQHGPEADKARERGLLARGYRIVRFWNCDVLTNLPGCLQRLAEALAKPSLWVSVAPHGSARAPPA